MEFCGDLDLSSITTLAIGGFDGVHLGHKKLLDLIDSDGAMLVIESYNSDLTPKCIRSSFTEKNIVILPLETVRDFDGDRFVEYLKNSFRNLKKIVVGYDFRFGKNRSSGTEDLKRIFDGEVVVVDEVKLDDISIHSTYIRSLIRSGEIKKANRFLGHNYLIEGEIISGQGLGMRRLFPTLNLEVRRFLIPLEAVYATYTKIGKKLFRSVSFIGHRVSTDGSFAIETHILEENFTTGGAKTAQIYFVDLIRKNRKFSDLEDLKKAIAHDISQAKKILEKEKI